MVDVAGLRKINLEHGHKVGDEVLAQIATRVRATVRGNDPIGRLGSDELAVLLVGAPQDQAEQVVSKLIAKIQDEPLKIDEHTLISVRVRGVITEIAPGERSGEAAMARLYGQLRGAKTGEVKIVAPDERPPEGADTPDAGALATGTILGGSYRIVHELSRGAMGVVYRGEDLGLNRPVAIKVLRSDLASDKDLVARFRTEAAILASLHHPNLVQIYALGEHQGEVYFAMELVEGQPLSEVLRATLERKEWFPTEAAAQITLEIGDALDAMHQLGLIHRDVKPANILLDRERDRAVSSTSAWRCARATRATRPVRRGSRRPSHSSSRPTRRRRMSTGSRRRCTACSPDGRRSAPVRRPRSCSASSTIRSGHRASCATRCRRRSIRCSRRRSRRPRRSAGPRPRRSRSRSAARSSGATAMPSPRRASSPTRSRR